MYVIQYHDTKFKTKGEIDRRKVNGKWFFINTGFIATN